MLHSSGRIGCCLGPTQVQKLVGVVPVGSPQGPYATHCHLLCWADPMHTDDAVPLLAAATLSSKRAKGHGDHAHMQANSILPNNDSATTLNKFLDRPCMAGTPSKHDLAIRPRSQST